MGLFNFFHKLAPAYNSVRSGLAQAWDTGKKIVNGISHGVDVVDNILNQASSLPVVGSIANTVRGNPIYNVVKEVVHDAHGVVNNPILPSIAKTADKIVSGGLGINSYDTQSVGNKNNSA